MEILMSIKFYGSTSGIKYGKLGIEIRPSSKTVDAHFHLQVQEVADLVQGLFDKQDIPAFRHANQFTTLEYKK